MLSFLPVPSHDVSFIFKPVFILPDYFTLTMTQVNDQLLLFHAWSPAHGTILKSGATLGGGVKWEEVGHVGAYLGRLCLVSGPFSLYGFYLR